MIQDKYIDAISQIARREFGVAPTGVVRMTSGICNEVYSVAIGEREYIFRLKDEPRYMLGSHNHIPLFKSKGIKVPDILAEDYSKSWLPLAFQIQNKLPGRDLNEVIHTLSDNELKAIGADIADVFRHLSTVPNNGKFGVLWGDDKDLVDSWSAEVGRVTAVVIGWGRQTGVLDGEIEKVLSDINSEYNGYFDRIRPYTYFGDIAGKNVMIHDGKFAGLVDLDSLAQGDPLEALGRIKASWYGTHHGAVYSDAVMDALGLPDAQRKLVTMYALLNRTFWTLENGVQFNSNTSRTVDREREIEDKHAVAGLLAELKGEAQPIAPRPVRKRTATVNDVAVVDKIPVADEQVLVAQAAQPTSPGVVQPDEPIERVVKTHRSAVSVTAPSEMIPMPTEPPEVDIPVHVHESAPRHMLDDETPAATAGIPIARPQTRKPMLEASGLSKTYVSDGVGFNALKNVDLKIAQGDCIAIVGKSGSGKSTLMHLLACLDGPTEGYVYVDGGDTSTMSEPEKNRLRNEKFGFVFQQFFLNGRDTVFENVVLPLRIRGASDFDMITDADEALAAVSLVDKTDNKAKDLSGGEKQRVCIARALVGKPQVIFADEPTGNLDSNTGAAIENMLFDLNRDKGITLVIVTHDADLAKRCQRIVEMKDGQIVGEYKGEIATR